MWSDRDWLHHWIVGRVADWCLRQYFYQRIMGCEEYVPSSVVAMEPFQFLPGFFRVLLGIWAVFAQESFLHDAVMRHDVGRRWDDVLDGVL